MTTLRHHHARDSAITVVICTYNRARLLQATLDALREQVVRRVLDWDILVVDNNSRDETKAVVERFAASSPMPVSYAFEPRQGKSYALNTGIERAGGSILAFTDDDCLPEPGWIEGIAELMERWSADGIGGRILPAWSSDPPAWLANDEHLHVALALLEETEPRTVSIGPWEMQHGMRIWGSNMAFRRQAFAAVGGFNTGIGPKGDKLYRGEEPELVRRLITAGLKVVYDPALVVRHRIDRDRMVKRYFRKHSFDFGEGAAIVGGVPARHLFGIPPYLLPVLARHAADWIWAGLRRDPETFCKQLEVLEDLGYVVGHMKAAFRSRSYVSLAEGVR